MVIHSGKGILHHFLPLSCAEQDAYRWVVAWLHLMLPIVRHACVKLPEVLMRELLVLQFNDYTTMQDAIVEHKVWVVVLVVNYDALLA